MADSCATCFYFRGAACHAPLPSTAAGAVAWRPVDPTDWCGEGADGGTGRSYSSTVNSQPGTGGAGPGYLATSVTSATIAASGSIAVTTQLNLAYTPGARVRLTSTGSGAWTEGVVTGYDAAGLLTFTADTASGAGTHTDWNISLAGQPGAGISAKGTLTATAARTIVIANAAVQAGSHINFTPTNAAAATLMSSAASLYVSALSAGVSFTLATADSSLAAGTETFTYEITN